MSVSGLALKVTSCYARKVSDFVLELTHTRMKYGRWSVSRQTIFVVLIALLASGPFADFARAQSRDRVVATVEGMEITVGDVVDYSESMAYEYRFPEPGVAYGRALDDLIANALKRIDFFESGLARNDSITGALRRVVTEELRLAYVQHRYEDRYINEQVIRDEYDDMGRVVYVRQIILQKPPAATAAEIDSLRARVSQIQQQFDSGASFETLAERHSDAAASSRRALEASPITWEQTVRDPHAFILFHLSPGDVRSFEGSQAFSVVRVERTEGVPVPPLDEVRKEIVQALHGRYAGQATRAYRDEWMSLVDTTALRWHEAALDQLVKWTNTAGFVEGDYTEIVAGYLGRHDDAVVMTDGRGDVRLSDIPALFDEVLVLESSWGHDADFIQEFILEAVRLKRLARRARELGLEDQIWSAQTTSSALAQAFVRIYNEKQIEDRIPAPTNARLREFYQAHADSLFYQLERVNTEIIVRPDEDAAAALLEKVKSGVPWEEVSSRRLIRSFQRTREGEIVTLFSREPPYLGEIAFEMKPDEVAGPFAYDDDKDGPQYAVVRVTRRLEERQLSFDEVRERVAEAYAEHHEARLAKEVIDELRTRYEVVVRQDVLNELIHKTL